MIRRKTMIKIRKFAIIFFSLLLVFIWCNHNNSGSKESRVEHLPFIKAKSNDQDQQKITQLPNKKWSNGERKNLPETESSDILEKDLQFDFDDSESLRELQRKKRIGNPRGRYFVSSSKCSMPYVDPFSSEALAILQPVKYRWCSNESDLFMLKYDMKLQQYRLRVNKAVLSELSHPKNKISCSYREIDDGINVKAEEFDKKSCQQDAVLSRKSSGILTECHVEGKPLKIVQQDAFPLVQIPSKTPITGSQQQNKKPSIIMLGLDSLSRMNFKRTMPKTSGFLKDLGFFEMEGYNKVGDTLFSNLCAIFAGVHSDTKCLKRFNSIWRMFKEAGYTTAFAEDILHSSIPLEIPTDYQLSSLLTIIAESMSKFRRFGFEYCLGRRLSFSYLYDFCMQFAQRVIEELNQPAFGLFWSSTFTHNYPLGAISLDDKFMEYLEMMRKHRVFERSIVIVLSDQGQKAGNLVELPDSFLEERLPMLHIYLPKWFQETYPKFAQNLNRNRNRLTSPFDLHNTLRHILQLNASSPEELSHPISYFPTSQSLFHLVPEDRSCAEAGIGMHWCTCNEFVLLPNDASSYFLGKVLVYQINHWMLRKKFNRFCQRLQLSDLDYVERKLIIDDSTYGQVKTYSLRIRTYPLGGVFEATIRYSQDLNDIVDFRISDVSSMINYHNHSMCVDDRRAKKFCFCYPEHLDDNMKEWRTLKKKKKFNK